MKLYSAAMAVNPLRVRMFLAEKGITVDTVNLDILKGEHRQPEYRKICPAARVPALELDDGTVIRESVAICRYFEEQQPEPALFGASALQRTQVEMWQRIIEFELMMPIAMAFRHGHELGKFLQEQVPEFGEQQRAVANRRMDILNKELADREFIAGDFFSIADIAAFATFVSFRFADFSIDAEQQPHLMRWFKQIKARPGVEASK